MEIVLIVIAVCVILSLLGLVLKLLFWGFLTKLLFDTVSRSVVEHEETFEQHVAVLLELIGAASEQCGAQRPAGGFPTPQGAQSGVPPQDLQIPADQQQQMMMAFQRAQSEIAQMDDLRRQMSEERLAGVKADMAGIGIFI